MYRLLPTVTLFTPMSGVWRYAQTMVVCIVLLLIVVASNVEAKANKDPYKLLGVPNDAPPKVIKRAYRELAKKLHPDRNKAKNASERFAEINHAYDILSDPEKRAHYDRFGDDEQGTGGGGGRPNGMHNFQFGTQDMQNIFSFFTGGGPDMFQGSGSGFGFNQHPHRHHQQRPARNYFEDNTYIVELREDNWDMNIATDKDVAVVMFYTPSCQSCANLKRPFSKVASLMKNAVIMGAMNCNANQDQCDQFGVSTFPTILLFSYRMHSHPEQYNGAHKTSALYTFVDDAIPSFVTEINSQSWFSFDRSHSHLPRMLLFTQSKKLSPVVRSLSREFRDRVAFAQGTSDDSFFVSEFKIKSSSWLVYQAFQKDGNFKSFHVKGNEFQFLQKYVAKMLKKFPTPAVSSARDQSRDKVHSVSQLTYGNESKLLHRSRWNFILFCNNFETNEKSLINHLKKKHKSDPFEFFWASRSKASSEMKTAFSLDDDTDAAFVVVLLRPKTRKFLRQPAGTLSKKQYSQILNGVLDGMGHFHTLDTLPY